MKMGTTTEIPFIAANSTFAAAIESLQRLRKAETERIVHNVDSWVGVEALLTATDLDPETARLAKDFLAARAALRKHQAEKYREAHCQASSTISAYIKSILGVDTPARVTLPLHGVHYRSATETIESIAHMRLKDGVVSGSFITSLQNGASHSTRGFIVEGTKVSFVEDVDF